MFSLISERKLGDRRRSDTVVVLTINYADWGSDGVIILTRSAPYEKSKSLGSGGSMVARLKLKDIDGRAPPGVNTPQLCAFMTASTPSAGADGWIHALALRRILLAVPIRRGYIPSVRGTSELVGHLLAVERSGHGKSSNGQPRIYPQPLT